MIGRSAVRAAAALAGLVLLAGPRPALAVNGAAPATVAVPKALERQLKNQMKILILEDHRQPVVHYRFVVRAGAADEPAERAGLAHLTMRTLHRGVGVLDAKAVEEKLAELDAGYSAIASRDDLAITAQFRKADWVEGMRVLAGIVRQPSFPAAEFERERTAALAAIAASRDRDSTVADEHVAALVYGEHPYARPVLGDSVSVAAITRDDLVRFHSAFFKPNLCVLVVAGDVVPDQVVAAVELQFADWAKGEAPARPKAALPAFDVNRMRLLDEAAADRTEIRLGLPGASMRSPDAAVLEIVNRVLSSRLAVAAPGSDGLARPTRTALDPGQDTGALVVSASVEHAAVGATIDGLLRTIGEFRAAGPSKAEVEEARRSLVAALPLTVDTLAKLAAAWAAIDLYDLGADWFELYDRRLAAVTPAIAKAAGEKYLRAERFALVAVGPADSLRTALAKHGPVEVLDPRSPTGAVPTSRPRLSLPKESFAPEAVAKAAPIVARALEAHGGAAKLLAVKDLTSRSTVAVTTPNGSVPGEMRVVIAIPDRTRIEMAMLGQSGVQVLNGDQAWSSTGAKVSELSGEQKQAMEAGIRAQVVPFLQRLAAGRNRVAWAEEGTVGDEPVDVLQLLDEGTLVRASFGRRSGYLVRVEQEEPALFGGGRVPMARLYSDFRAVDGIILPFRTERLARGERLIEDTVTSLEVNRGVAASQFQRPAR